MPALGAVFALLTATSLAAEAGQYRSAEDNVSAEAAAASRMAWASTSPGIDSRDHPGRPRRVPHLHPGPEWKGGDRDGDPKTMRALGELERTVRVRGGGQDGRQRPGRRAARLARQPHVAAPPAPGHRRQRAARALPDRGADVGPGARGQLGRARHHPPARLAALTAGLVVVVALALALLVAISAPFRGGFIVEGGPIDAVRDQHRCRRLPTVSLLVCILIVLVSVAVGITLMLLARRRAPDGSWFNDGDRASGVFGVLATGFAVLLGLVVVLAFTSFDESRSGAETEALVVSQQYETAQFMPEAYQAELSGQLVCYARYVVDQAWPRMEDGTQEDQVNPWAVEMFRTTKQIEPESNAEQAAYGKWIDQTSDRETGPQRPPARRRGRHPHVALDRPALQRRRHLLVHAPVRRQRRGRGSCRPRSWARWWRSWCRACCSSTSSTSRSTTASAA